MHLTNAWPLSLLRLCCYAEMRLGATWRRHRFVRDKLLSVNHCALINLGFCVTGGAYAGSRSCFHDIACAQIDVRSGRTTTAEARTRESCAASSQSVSRSLGRSAFRTTFWMIIEVDGCDTGSWKLYAGRARLTSSRNTVACTQTRSYMHKEAKILQASTLSIRFSLFSELGFSKSHLNLFI